MAKRRVKQKDSLTSSQRSDHMRKIRSRRNKSTEMRVAARFIRSGLRGWCKHPRHLEGHPDFCFSEKRLAVFVDGCFWHGCPQCRRNVPSSRPEFWSQKILTNKRRDARVNRILRSQGYAVVRIW